MHVVPVSSEYYLNHLSWQNEFKNVEIQGVDTSETYYGTSTLLSESYVICSWNKTEV